MLIFNPSRVMTLRGIENKIGFLVENGFVRATAVNIINGWTGLVKIEHLEKLCALLNCTPNDLFEWRATDKSLQLSEKHQLKNLQRTAAPSLKEMIRDVPLEKLNEITALLNEEARTK